MTTNNNNKETKKISLETMIDNINQIVDTLDQKKIPLDKSLNMFEEGMVLIKKAKKELSRINERMIEIIKINPNADNDD